jgi:hypothetical protein
MAGDSQLTYGTTKEMSMRKVFRRRNDGALLGVAGTASLATKIIEWFLNDEEYMVRPGFGTEAHEAQAILVRPDGTVEFHDLFGYHIVEGKFFVTGTGADVALGALEMGATPQQAVRIASKYDTKTGGKVCWVKQKKKK